MKWELPVVGDKRRTVRIGGEARTAQTINLQADIKKQSAEDIRTFMKLITIDETEQQGKLGNEPTAISVDNVPSKPLAKAQYRTDVVFGSLLQRAMVAAVEIELAKSIKRLGYVDTGQLQKVRQSWEWLFVPGKGEAAERINPMSIKFMPIGAMLILRPKVEYAGYATVINRTAGGATYQGEYAARKGRAPRRGTGVTGFMGDAAQRLRRSRHFKRAFSIYASYSKRNRTHGDDYRHGTPVIVVRPRVTRAKRRVRVKT